MMEKWTQEDLALKGTVSGLTKKRKCSQRGNADTALLARNRRAAIAG